MSGRALRRSLRSAWASVAKNGSRASWRLDDVRVYTRALTPAEIARSRATAVKADLMVTTNAPSRGVQRLTTVVYTQVTNLGPATCRRNPSTHSFEQADRVNGPHGSSYRVCPRSGSGALTTDPSRCMRHRVLHSQ